MKNTIYKTKIVYSFLSDNDVEEATACIAQTYSQSEPMTTVLGIGEEEFISFARILIEKAVWDGMSVVVRNTYTHQFLGCLICKDYATELPEGIEGASPLFNPILNLLHSLGTTYRLANQVKKGEIYHLFMGGVYSEYVGAGITARMTHFVEKAGEEKGCKGVISEASSPASQHLYIQQLGYHPLFKINYRDFLYENKYVFKDITSCESCVLIYKPL